MIVPRFWAETRVRGMVGGHQVTVRRFGWSDTSQEEAEATADARAQEAFARIAGGEKLAKREPKVPYGIEGIPIREEIVSRHGEAVVTRNVYGAHCLNTPDVLFADIDFETGPAVSTTLAVLFVLLSGALAIGWDAESWRYGLLAAVAALVISGAVSRAITRLTTGLKGGPEKRARDRIGRFVAQHPDWHLRVYRTPAGFRVLAMQRTFDPAEGAVKELFDALGTDPTYVRMCQMQRCFRARVSPKPWRIGIEDHLRPRPGVWPVDPARMPERNRWIARYELKARDYASCRFVEALGSGSVHPAAQAVQALHDNLSRATSPLPIA